MSEFKPYDTSRHLIGICRVCQRCPDIHKILLKDYKKNPSRYDLKYSSYASDCDCIYYYIYLLNNRSENFRWS